MSGLGRSCSNGTDSRWVCCDTKRPRSPDKRDQLACQSHGLRAGRPVICVSGLGRGRGRRNSRACCRTSRPSFLRCLNLTTEFSRRDGMMEDAKNETDFPLSSFVVHQCRARSIRPFPAERVRGLAKERQIPPITVLMLTTFSQTLQPFRSHIALFPASGDQTRSMM